MDCVASHAQLKQSFLVAKQTVFSRLLCNSVGRELSESLAGRWFDSAATTK